MFCATIDLAYLTGRTPIVDERIYTQVGFTFFPVPKTLAAYMFHNFPSQVCPHVNIAENLISTCHIYYILLFDLFYIYILIAYLCGNLPGISKFRSPDT